MVTGGAGTNVGVVVGVSCGDTFAQAVSRITDTVLLGQGRACHSGDDAGTSGPIYVPRPPKRAGRTGLDGAVRGGLGREDDDDDD